MKKSTVAAVAVPSGDAGLFLLFTSGANGGFVSEIDYQAIGSGTCGTSIMNIWKTDTGGVNAQIIKSITVAAGTGAISTTNAGVFGSNIFSLLNLATGEKIYVSFTVLAANVTYNVVAFGGQF